MNSPLQGTAMFSPPAITCSHDCPHQTHLKASDCAAALSGITSASTEKDSQVLQQGYKDGGEEGMESAGRKHI
jgi:hypothetical protein